MKLNLVFSLITFFSLLTGCPSQTTPTKPDQQEKHTNLIISDVRHENLLKPFSSKPVDIVSNWQPNSYYARLYVEPFGMVSGISKCQNASSFIKGLKEYFGIQNAVGFYFTVDISSQDKVIADNIVILSYLVEDTNNKCETESLKGYLTPYFKVNPSLDIKVSYKIHYSEKNNIEVVKKLTERTNSIINYFAPKSVGVLINEVFSPVIAPIDNAIQNSLNVIATDTLSTQFSLNTPVGQKRIDGSTLDFSPIFPEGENLSKGIGAKLNLVYYKSVIGLGEDKVIYEDDPSQMLSSILDSKRDNLDVYSILQQDKVSGIVANTLKAFNKKEHKNYLADACRSIKNYSSTELGLTKDDSLALRWAILTEFTNYNDSLDIRSDACFRQKELQNLIDLNRDYIFKEERELIPEQRATYTRDLMYKFAGSAVSDHLKDRKIFDMDNLSLYISLSDPLPNDIQEHLSDQYTISNKNNLIYYGEKAISKLQKILSRARCARISSVSPNNDLAFVGKLDTIQSKPKYVLGGLRVDRYGNKNKIKTIYLVDKDLIDQFIRPYEKWPIGQSEGLCPKEKDIQFIMGIKESV